MKGSGTSFRLVRLSAKIPGWPKIEPDPAHLLATLPLLFTNFQADFEGTLFVGPRHFDRQPVVVRQPGSDVITALPSIANGRQELVTQPYRGSPVRNNQPDHLSFSQPRGPVKGTRPSHAARRGRCVLPRIAEADGVGHEWAGSGGGGRCKGKEGQLLLAPNIMAWVKQSNDFVCRRVDCRKIRALEEIAPVASECKVRQIIVTAVLLSTDMFYVKSNFA